MSSKHESLTERLPPLVPEDESHQMDILDLFDLASLNLGQEDAIASSIGTDSSSIETTQGSNASDSVSNSTNLSASSSTEAITANTNKEEDNVSKRSRKDDERGRNRKRRRSRSPIRRGVARTGRSRSPRADRLRDRRYHPRKMRHERDAWDRRRSRSPLRNRSDSPTRNRSRTPPRYRRHSRSPTDNRGRSRSPAGNSLRDKGDKKEGLLPVPMNLEDRTTESGLKDVGEKPSLQSVIVKAGTPNDKLDKVSRCRDFNEKGLCMRGELCPFDHGSDSVVLEDVGMSGVPTSAGNVDFNRALQSGGYGGASTSIMRPAVTAMDEYYPDNPAMAPSSWGNPIFQPCGMRYDPILRVERGGMMPIGPFLCQRELTSVPIMGMQVNSEDVHEQQSIIVLHDRSGRGMLPRRGCGRGFDYRRLETKDGFLKRMKRNLENCSLEFRRIPSEQNNLMDLNSHFQKFGKIVNIQINFENDPEAAVVTFSSPSESQSAYRSTEAVLNNRFIRVFWHNKDKGSFHSCEGGDPQSMPLQEILEESQDEVLSSTGLPTFVFHPSILEARTADSAAAAAAEKARAVEAIKKNQEMLAARESLKRKQEEKKKEALQLCKNLRQRKQYMISAQIQEHKKLISKLETGKGTMKRKEREELMKSLEEGIKRLRKDLDQDGSKACAAQPIPKSKEEAQREMLDAELEPYKKEQEGEDTVAYQNKIFDLRAKAKSMGMSYRGRGGFRGSHRGFGGRGRGGRQQQRALTTVDRRPTIFKVTGFPIERLPEILPHFSQFGTITEYETDHHIPSMILSFETRKSAEVALGKGKMFGETALTIDWVSNENSEGRSQYSSNGDTHNDEIRNATDSSIQDDQLGDILAQEILLSHDEDE